MENFKNQKKLLFIVSILMFQSCAEQDIFLKPSSQKKLLQSTEIKSEKIKEGKTEKLLTKSPRSKDLKVSHKTPRDEVNQKEQVETQSPSAQDDEANSEDQENTAIEDENNQNFVEDQIRKSANQTSPELQKSEEIEIEAQDETEVAPIENNAEKEDTPEELSFDHSQKERLMKGIVAFMNSSPNMIDFDLIDNSANFMIETKEFNSFLERFEEDHSSSDEFYNKSLEELGLDSHDIHNSNKKEKTLEALNSIYFLSHNKHLELEYLEIDTEDELNVAIDISMIASQHDPTFKDLALMQLGILHYAENLDSSVKENKSFRKHFKTILKIVKGLKK